MLNSKQRAHLRSLANGLTPSLYIGKEGVTENIIKQAEMSLEANELIKCGVQQNSGITAKEACELIALKTGAEPVGAIGRKFILYRESKDNKNILL